MEIVDSIFNRSTLLLGEATMELVKSKRVIIFGVGGVGSWCAESLIRSGISHLTIVDSDKVSVTNVNRQLEATTKTVGQVKVEVLKQRLLEINPQAEIKAVQEVYSAETAPLFQLEGYDYIIDAIDTLENKARLILHATSCPGKLFSAMGAALKIDPTKVQVAEFWEVQGCPLARAIRKKFKKKDEYPNKHFLCVFSDEVLPNKGAEENPSLSDEDASPSKAQTNGTLVHITAIFGFTIAGLIMKDILNTPTRS